jgi:hypothetical protein
MLEHFKGIEFVRISSLPEEQKEKIWQSFQQDKIIKIVRDQSLLNDCILYNDYVSWLNQNSASTTVSAAANSKPINTKAPVFSKLAFK